MELTYFCSLCDQNHIKKIQSLKWDESASKPFPLSFIHTHNDTHQEIFTVLYFNKETKIERVFTSFQKDMEKNPLLKEIINLQEHFQKLKSKYDQTIVQLKEKISLFDQSNIQEV